MEGHGDMDESLQKESLPLRRLRPVFLQHLVRLEIAALVDEINPHVQMRHDEVVFDFWKRLRKPASEPLRGAPATRRMKHYAAASGYAYEYFFEGYRDEPGARVYHFTLSGDRKTWKAFTLTLPFDSVKIWEENHGRTLESNERYAVVKIALFETFDRIDSPALFPDALTIEAAQVDEHAANLGLD